MRRTRRTRFAASFVAVVAAGCTHEHASGGGSGTGTGTAIASGTDTAAPKKPISTWHVGAGNDGTTCYATPIIDCSGAPAGVSCNPPASTAVSCLSPMPADGYLIQTFDGSHCLLADGTTPTACPNGDAPPPTASATPDAAPSPPPFTPRMWSIQTDHMQCTAELIQGQMCPPSATCNPPAPTHVDCKTYAASDTVHEVQPGQCEQLKIAPEHCPHGAHCNPPPPTQIPVPCP